MVSDPLWAKFCATFALDDLWADETLRSNNARVLARDRIMPQVRALMATMTRDQIVAKLEGTGMPFAPIGRPEDMFDDPQLADDGLEDVTLEDGKETRLPTIPLQMGGKRPGGPVTLPLPGADSRTVLEALGYDSARINALVGLGAVGTA